MNDNIIKYNTSEASEASEASKPAKPAKPAKLYTEGALHTDVKDVLDHLSVLKAVDDSIFLLNNKH